MKRFDVISIFPHSLDSYFATSILKRAQKNKIIKITTHDLHKWTKDKHKTVDDKPYGGGAGMLLKVEPIYRALCAFKRHSPLATRYPKKSKQRTRIILLAANGKQFTHKDAVRLTKFDRLIFICGRYEGVDARVEYFIDEKISIGPYVLTGGELPAAIIIDAVTRQLPHVVGKKESILNESFSKNGILEHAHYTKPEIFKIGKTILKVPRTLLSGHHKQISEWRQKHSKIAKK